MKKSIFLAMVAFISNFMFITAQTSTETFETETDGTKIFSDNGYTFNIVSHTTNFFIQTSYAGTGWNGSANDNGYIDNTGSTAGNPSFSITNSSIFTVSKF